MSTTLATGRVEKLNTTEELDTVTTGRTDDNSERVRQFGAAILEAGSVGRIADAVIAIALSQAWRDYTLEGYRTTWLAAEFDYFLIASGVRYVDMVAVLKWRAEASQLAPLMDQRASERRPLNVASAEWNPPLPPGVTLVTLAKDLGWVTDRGRSRKPPVGRRSRARAAGASREERAREARRHRVGPERCAELEELGATLAAELDADECRILAEVLNVAAGRRDGGMAK
jgi:hypothetical protein